MPKTKEQVLAEGQEMVKKTLQESTKLTLTLNQLSNPDRAWVEESLKEYTQEIVLPTQIEVEREFIEQLSRDFPGESYKSIQKPTSLRDRIEAKMQGK